MENIDFYLNVLNRYIDKTQEYLPLYAMFEITNSCNFSVVIVIFLPN